MCGIVGYVGKRDAVPILLDSLKRLEYRGYDSAGIAVLKDHKIVVHKTKGKISDLESTLPSIKGAVGIGHTRWATHGQPTTTNAHPHVSGNIAVVHNGIIENYQELKEKLIEKGYVFVSETDTEVLAHLIHSKYKSDLQSAVANALKEVKGSYAIAVLCSDAPDHMIGARKDSPLVVGLGGEENFLASDIPAILKHTRRVVYVSDFELVSLKGSKVTFFDEDGQVISKKVETIEWDVEAAEKAGYEHFMLKEIHEQATSVHNTLAGKVLELEGSVEIGVGLSSKQVSKLTRIEIIACGTSYNAGMLGKYLFERLAGIHVDVDTGSEFRYSFPVIGEQALVIAITQSGETADTLAAVREAKAYGCKTLAITNVVGSTITREVDYVLYTRAGPEIGVAATKTFTSQLVALYLLALYFSRIRGRISAEEARRILISLKKIPGKIQWILDNKEPIIECANRFACSRDFFFIGRSINYPIALEGALKLKEISYIHAEGYAAGELKHGPLALITQGTPVVAIATRGHTYDKVLSNIKEVKARDAMVIAIANLEDNEIEKYVDVVLRIPATDELLSPVLSTIIVQLLAYYTAKANNCSIDKPRNLAKSVTVE